VPPAPAAPAPAPDIEPEPVPVPEPEPAPVAAAEETAALPATPTPPVPAALVDHARKVAADHQARTGSPIDTDTLRTRLGVPPHLADAIAAQLA
ncbi:SpdA protein, partial [Streptomyces sp. NPDC006356]